MESKPTVEELKQFVKDALNEFYRNDAELITLGVREDTMSHRIAVYLEQILIEKGYKKYHVDREYDKHGKLPKWLKPKIPSNGYSHRPDIVIHERGNDNNNLLLVEVKKNKALTDGDNDDLKLKCAIDPECFKYNLGLYINIINATSANLTWYEFGKDNVSEDFRL